MRKLWDSCPPFPALLAREIPDLIYLLRMAKSPLSLYQRPRHGILKSEKKVIFFFCAGL
jgi:hypothetical protein